MYASEEIALDDRRRPRAMERVAYDPKLTLDEIKAKLQAQGVNVTPNSEVGGFTLVGAKGQIDSGWFATEEGAWAYAWASEQINEN